MVGWVDGRTYVFLKIFWMQNGGKSFGQLHFKHFFLFGKVYEIVRCFSKSQNFFLQLKLGHKKILLTLTEKLVKHH